MHFTDDGTHVLLGWYGTRCLNETDMVKYIEAATTFIQSLGLTLRAWVVDGRASNVAAYSALRAKYPAAYGSADFPKIIVEMETLTGFQCSMTFGGQHIVLCHDASHLYKVRLHVAGGGVGGVCVLQWYFVLTHPAYLLVCCWLLHAERAQLRERHWHDAPVALHGDRARRGRGRLVHAGPGPEDCAARALPHVAGCRGGYQVGQPAERQAADEGEQVLPVSDT
jgi:hypothetical protein